MTRQLITKLVAGPFQTPATHADNVESNPLGWPDVVRSVAKCLNAEVVLPEAGQVLAQNAVWLCWNPYAALCANTLWSKRSIYLFWGVSNAAGFLRKIATLRLRWILRRVGTICVNDCVSAGDVLRLSGRKAHVIPYVVDTEFFRSGSCPRNSTIVVPGNNDRDEEFVASLVAEGRSVIRVTSSGRIRDHYVSRGLGSILRYRVPFIELRDLYQQCGVVLFPISNPNHAAGQTAILEALACGAPAVITPGRTATIVEKYPGVRVSGNDLLLETIDQSLAGVNAQPSQSIEQHRVVSANHSLAVCVDSLMEHLLAISGAEHHDTSLLRNAA